MCVINCEGDIVGVKKRRISNSTNLVVEVIAISNGVQFRIARGFIPLIVGIDFLTKLNILEGRCEVPWSMIMEVEMVNMMRKGFLILLQHTLREGNTLVENMAKKILNTNKISLPYLRKTQINNR